MGITVEVISNGLSAAADLSSTVSAMVDVHIACCEQDGTIATFLPPYDDAKRTRMAQYYQNQFEEVRQGRRAVFLARSAEITERSKLAGFVMLAMPEAETGPFRGTVDKLLVSPNFRKQGVARALLESLEKTAMDNGRTLLTLDTEEGSPAQSVYPRLGYEQCGRIPQYGYSPLDGSLKNEIFFYKILKGHPEGRGHE